MRSVKTALALRTPEFGITNAAPTIVGIIASAGDLRLATRMRNPPDLFELRLDHLIDLRESQISKLRSPLIITARHPAEGGAGELSAARRRQLLLPFLPHAAAVDIELRSITALHKVWTEARRRGLERICSLHNFNRTPSLGLLRKEHRRAQSAGADIFKLVTRAENVADWSTLLEFLLTRRRSPRLCIMAVGKFGPISRRVFPVCGSCLLYAPLRHRLYPGQLTLAEISRLKGDSRGAIQTARILHSASRV
jgi:3-dehydroquinate dehydratase-1